MVAAARLHALIVCSNKPKVDLSLAGASDTTWSGGGVAVGDWRGINCTVGEGSNVWNLSVLEGAGSLATSRLSALLVGGDVEGYEKEEVGAEDTHASESSELLTGALASVWKV